MSSRHLLSLLAVLVLGGFTPGAQGATSYQDARWDPIHFKPAIDSATDEQCLACHQEVLDDKVLQSSPAGVQAADTSAWYQTLNTYEGGQETFHRRHLVTPYAKQVMDLKCNTCHQGNDPRDETANSSATGSPDLTQRKQVDPNICLMCHGPFNYKNMNLPGPWVQFESAFQTCITCHQTFRTRRHQVNFLKADAIEEAAKKDSDVCYGCHGGRSWYRIAFAYPRHAWPGMPAQTPEWAKDRPTESEARFRIPETTAQGGK